MATTETNSSSLLREVLLAVPIIFHIGNSDDKEIHYIHQPTLGVILLCTPWCEKVGLPTEPTGTLTAEVALSAVIRDRDSCLRIISAYSEEPTPQMVNQNLLEDKAKYYGYKLNDEEISSLLVAIDMLPSTTEAAMSSGITREMERTRRILKSKKDSSSISVGGVTIYGTLIDIAIARYGWTLQYILWGITYANINLLLYDRQESIYLSDEERRSVRPSDRHRAGVGEIISADDPRNRRRISAILRGEE